MMQCNSIHNFNHCEAFRENIDEKPCALEYNLIITSLLKDFVTGNNVTRLCT